MRGKILVTLEDFSKGVNLGGSKYDTALNMAYDATDLEPLSTYGLRKREATANFKTGYGQALDFLLASRALSLLFIGEPGATTGRIHKLDYAGTTSTQIGADLSNFNSPLFAIEAPTVGGQGPTFWAGQTGTADTDASAYVYASASAHGAWTGPPAGRVRAMVYHGNRVWIAIGTSLYFSDIGNPTSFPAANVVQLEPWASGTLDSSGSITALVPCGPILLAFKNSRSWVIYDLDTGANRVLGPAGCSGARACVQSSEGEVYFADAHGVYRTNSSTIQTISTNVTGSVLTFIGGRYLLASGNLIDADKVKATFVYDTLLKSWWRHRIGVVPDPPRVDSGGGFVFAIPHPVPAGIPTTLHVSNSITNKRIVTWRPDHAGATNAAATADAEGANVTVGWSGGLVELEKEIATKKRLREAEVIGAGTEAITVLGQSVNFGVAGTAADVRKRLASLGVSREWNLTLTGTGGTDANERVLSVTMAFIPRKN